MRKASSAMLNSLGNLIGYKVISSGGSNSMVLDYKVIFRHALFLGADSIIMTHNHPPGDPQPTINDVRATQKLAEAGRVVDISLLDHVIYTPYQSVSMRRMMAHLFEGD
ncbi:MAG: DNA repair protein RadC [Phenylobacterium sp.]|jgi:DNA repair protein RadC